VIDNALTRPWSVSRSYRRDPDGGMVLHRLRPSNNPHVVIGTEFYMLSADGYLMPTKKDSKAPDLRFFNATKSRRYPCTLDIRVHHDRARRDHRHRCGPCTAAAQPTFATTKSKAPITSTFPLPGSSGPVVVTPEGVIATDPISEDRPAAAAYLAEIRKITQARSATSSTAIAMRPHPPAGKPFKDAGATFVAHRLAKDAIAKMNAPTSCRSTRRGRQAHDQRSAAPRLNCSTSGKTTPTTRWWCGLRAADHLHGRLRPGCERALQQHARLLPARFRGVVKKVLALEWDRMIPGHGRIGTKQDVQQTLSATWRTSPPK